MIGRFRTKYEVLNLLSIKPQWCVQTITSEYKEVPFYQMKELSRVDGPWSDKDPKPVYIPRQYKGLINNLWPFQAVIHKSIEIFEKRIINYIFCESGNTGKSTIAALMELHENCIDLPPVNDLEGVMQCMLDECYNITHSPRGVFIDLPRGMDQSKLYGIYSAIEQIKKGKLYDRRYKYRKWWIDSPQIWVFSNHPPDIHRLSAERWKIWSIHNRELEEWTNPLDSFVPSESDE